MTVTASTEIRNAPAAGGFIGGTSRDGSSDRQIKVTSALDRAMLHTFAGARGLPVGTSFEGNRGGGSWLLAVAKRVNGVVDRALRTASMR